MKKKPLSKGALRFKVELAFIRRGGLSYVFKRVDFKCIFSKYYL